MASFFGECKDAKDEGTYECEWHHTWAQVTKNSNGTSGWATILQSTNAARPKGTVCRIHVCSQYPCTAPEKYSLFGWRMHLQPVHKPAESPAVAESPTPLIESLPPMPSEPPPPLAPPEKPPTVVETPQAPASPKTAALPSLKPADPAKPIDLDDEDDDMATARPSSSVEAQDKIHTTLLALARSIRRPRTYVGYSAFILMGLLKKCRPCAWEGPFFIDLMQMYAPWAIEDCTR